MPLYLLSSRFGQLLALAGALAFVYASVLPPLVREWWHDPNYSHGLLVPFVAGYLLWQERFTLRNETFHPAFKCGVAMSCGALLMLWLGVAGAELYLQRFSLILLLAGLAVAYGGAKLLRWAALPLFLVWLAVPLPALIFNRIALPLQLFASQCAMHAMQLLEIPVLRQGNIIELLPLGATETKKLEVAEACSGIRSLMALITLATVLAYLSQPAGPPDDDPNKPSSFLQHFPFWRGVFLVLAAVCIAIFTNALRVSGTGVLAHFYGLRVAEGFFHTFSGWAVYIVAFGLLWLTARLFDWLTQTRFKADESPLSLTNY